MYEILENKHYLQRPACKMVSIFRFKSSPDFDQFEEAIKKGMNKHELLRTRVLRHEDGRAFYEDNSEAQVHVNLEKYESPEEDEEDVETMLDIALEWSEDEDKVPLNLEEGEYMHHGIFSDGVETVWAISSHYLAGDAQSIQILAKDILNIYDSTSSTVQKVSYIHEDITDEEARTIVSGRLSRQIDKYNSRWERYNKLFGWDLYQELYETFHSNFSLKTLETSFDKDVSQRIIRRAKEDGIKLNALIAAAFSVATDERESIGVPLSTRKEGNRSVGVYGSSVSINPTIKIGMKYDLISTAERINKELTELMGNDFREQRSNAIISRLNGNLLDAGYYAAFMRYDNAVAKDIAKLFSLNKPGDGMQLNNLGEVNFEKEYSFGTLEEMYYVPSIITNFRRAISYVTFDDRIFLTSVFYQEKDLELLNLIRAKEILEQYANS